MILKKYCLFLLLGFTFFSCVKNVDFDQVDDFDSKPKFIASLVFFKIPALSFLDNTNAEITGPIIDQSNLTIIEEEVVQDNLLEIVFDFEITNPFDRNINLNIEFLDDSNVVTYTVTPLLIQANTSKFQHKETIIISGSPLFLNTRKIRTSLELLTTTGTPIDPNDLNEFIFKSAGTFTFKI
ncbi:hypothetical protein F7018_12110 [Tenacibaculum aiptasiae]|uniref:Late embryogenesis abundant protein LEA-2 subgroup domain-containing protein n=1 Tax=Tenacibaculum aiptasiae TaxID=426481 RepID=A0A7J5ACG6_9FLAO|nr:hypothetical protein [Tenacibaculum aiptasiae]KAB1155215.1 hypothetical protein F7018_12110 [Tenacibaculum aiptasiae]